MDVSFNTQTKLVFSGMEESATHLLILTRNILKGFALEKIAMSANTTGINISLVASSEIIVNWNTSDPVTILISTVENHLDIN